MKLCQLNILKNFPFRPKVEYNRELVTPSWKELWEMYDRADYVCRVINQVIDGPNDGLFSMNETLTLLYAYVHEGKGYHALTESVRYKIRDTFYRAVHKEA